MPRFETLARSHNRVGFACVHSEFEVYLAQLALQHARKGVAVTTVLLVEDDVTVFAYHTLSASRISLGDLAAELARKFPRFSEGIPATLVGRLAVDRRQEGKGYGRLTLMNALERAFLATSRVASAFVIVRAIDDEASRFYRRFGFVPFPDDRFRLFLPMHTVAQLMRPG